MAPDKTQFRPHVVWFNEQVPMIIAAKKIMTSADIFVLVGTSLQVYPAAGLIDYVSPDVPKYIIDKQPPYIPPHHNFHVIEKSATEGIKDLLQILIT